MSKAAPGGMPAAFFQKLFRRRLHFNAAVPPDPFRRRSQAWVKRTFNPREDKNGVEARKTRISTTREQTIKAFSVQVAGFFAYLEYFAVKISYSVSALIGVFCGQVWIRLRLAALWFLWQNDFAVAPVFRFLNSYLLNLNSLRNPALSLT
jgi:hypothetical protein